MANPYPGGNTSDSFLVLSNSGQSDISCVAYNDILRGPPEVQTIPIDKQPTNLQGRLQAILRANTADTGRRISRRTSSSLSQQNISNTAGAGFTPNFPSQCANCGNITNCDLFNKNNPNRLTYNEKLLAKKAYIFRQNLGNVTSGPITINGRIQFNNAATSGGFPGPGLTKNKMLSNAGKGLSVSGQPQNLIRGYQSQLVTNPNVLSGNPNLRTIIIGQRSFIPLCANRKIN